MRLRRTTTPELPEAKDFIPELFGALHHTYHEHFPGEAHDDGDVMEYSRGWLYGLRFALEYRKWARLLKHIAFDTDLQRPLNPPLGTDSLARWMSERFAANPLEGKEFIDKLKSLRDVEDGPSDGLFPVIVDGQLAWTRDKPEPDDGYQEASWRGT